MFVAWRDLRSARGRFALIGAVVALITVLVGFLTGLTGGLAAQNVSAVLEPGRRPDRLRRRRATSFADSSLTDTQTADWTAMAAPAQVSPLGISQLRAARCDQHRRWPCSADRARCDPARPGNRRHRLAVRAGAPPRWPPASVNRRDRRRRLTLSRPSRGDAWYSHTPVVWTTLADWQPISRTADPVAVRRPCSIVRGDADVAAIDAAAGTQSAGPRCRR